MHTKNTTKQFMHTDYSCSGWVSIFIPWSATQWIIQMFLIFEKIIRSRICPCIHWALKKDILCIQIRPGYEVKIKSGIAIMWKWNWNKFWIILVIFCSIFFSPFLEVVVFFLGTWIFNSLWSFSSWFHASFKCCCKICYMVLWNSWN